MRRLGAGMLIGASLLGCGDDSGEDVAAKAAQEREEMAAAREARFAAAAKEKRGKARRALVDALNELRKVRRSTPFAEALKAGERFCAALAAAVEEGVEVKAQKKGQALCDDAGKLAKAVTSDPPAAPEKPVKPELDLPKYTGCEKIMGTIRGKYTDTSGVVIEQRGELLVLEDGVMPRSGFVRVLHGYADDTGRVAKLNVGRDGRDARVLLVKDKETYADDQRAHRIAVKKARNAHAREMAAFRKAIASWPKTQAEHDAAVEEHAQAVERGKVDFVRLLADFDDDEK